MTELDGYGARMTGQMFLHYLGNVASAAFIVLILAIVVLRTLPAKLAERFFGYAFDKGIARLKHDQDTALAHVQAQLSHLGDRGTRSNEREYEAIITSWEAFVGAFFATTACVSGLRRYPDLASMSCSETTDYFENVNLTQTDQNYILNSYDKSKALRHVLQVKGINSAGHALRDAFDTANRRSVFIPDALAQQIEDALQYLQTAQIEQSFLINSIDPAPDRTKCPTSIDLITGEGRRIFQELREAVRARVLYDGSIVAAEAEASKPHV